MSYFWTLRDIIKTDFVLHVLLFIVLRLQVQEANLHWKDEPRCWYRWHKIACKTWWYNYKQHETVVSSIIIREEHDWGRKMYSAISFSILLCYKFIFKIYLQYNFFLVSLRLKYSTCLLISVIFQCTTNRKLDNLNMILWFEGLVWHCLKTQSW